MRRLQRFTTTALLSVFAALLTACGSTEPAKEQAMAPKPVTPEERVQRYQDCWKDFNEQQWDDFRNCYTSTTRVLQLGDGKNTEVTGLDATVASAQDFRKQFPDARGEGQLILANGPHIAGIFLLTGTNSVPLTGPDGKEMPATNKKFGLLYGHAVDTEPESTKVMKETGVMDSGDFASQLGLSKQPGRPLMEKGVDTPTIVIARNDATESANIDAEKASIDTWNKHDAAANDALSADDLVFHDMTSPKDFNRKENSDSNTALWKAFSDAKLTASDMWAAGDYVVMMGTFEGTNDGDFPAMGLKKSGKKATVPFMEVDKFDGGKIKESWLFFDSGMFASQLGMMPTK